jgi:hypothetical protein
MALKWVLAEPNAVKAIPLRDEFATEWHGHVVAMFSHVWAVEHGRFPESGPCAPPEGKPL